MSATVHFSEPQDSQEHTSKPLDEAVWRAWLKKNLFEEKQRAAGRIKAANWVSIGVLIVATSHVSTSYVSAYQVIVRVVIALGGTIMIFESLRTRKYISAASFAGIVALFNPVFPAFALSENWPILIASTLPFVAALIGMRELSKRANV